MTNYSLLRNNIISALGGECKKCGSNIALQIDHIVPIRTQDKRIREQDMRHPNLSNLQLLCYPCHLTKTKQDNAN